MDPPPPPPAVAAPAAGAAADDAACCCWQPALSRRALVKAQLGMAVVAAAFALFASTLEPATFANLPAHCVTTPADAIDLRYNAAVLLLFAMAQAGTATAALVVVPPSLLRRFLGFLANLLGIVTPFHLFGVVHRALFATGALCFGGMVDLLFAAIFATTFLAAVPFLWFIGQPQDPIGG